MINVITEENKMKKKSFCFFYLFIFILEMNYILEIPMGTNCAPLVAD